MKDTARIDTAILVGSIRNFKSLDNQSLSINLDSLKVIGQRPGWEIEPTFMGWTETYLYDSSDRLTQVNRNNKIFQTMEYDYNGNILSKTNVGTYSYHDEKIHALTGIDVGKNKYAPGRQDVTYNFFGKAETLSEFNGDEHRELYITYGPDMERWKSELYIDGEEKRTVIYSDDYECVMEGGVTRHFYYLGGNVIYIRQADGTGSAYYATTDNQGSIMCIVNASGTKVFEAAYDAWGKQSIIRNNIGFIRGYTGHEMLPEFGLINMNGRMYDPVVSRFLSPDNYVQMPENTQNFNRYSYCLNNPLKYSDPTGEYAILDDIIAAFLGGVINLGFNISQGYITGNFWSLIGKGAAAFGAGAVAGWGGLYPELGGWLWGGGVLGSTNSWLSGGTGTDIFCGAILGGLSSFAGGAFGQWGAKYLGSAIISGISTNSPILKGMISGALGGMSSGAIGGFTFGLMMTGDFDDALDTGYKGLVNGITIGAVIGSMSGIKYSRDNKVSPWTGEKTQNHHSHPKFIGEKKISPLHLCLNSGIRICIVI